jgi:hypothetical protein
MKYYLSIIFILISLSLGFSASVNVDQLDIVADGYFTTQTNTKFQMNTYFNFITSFDGGYKFAAKVAFETSVQQLALNYTTTPLGLGTVYSFFREAEVTARNLADSHLFLTFWTGTYKYLGAGNKYRGYMYYPTSGDNDIAGFYRLRGTGLSTELRFWEDRFRAELHLYQNTNFVTISPLALNYFSADAQIGLYFKNVYIEMFGGYTKEVVYPIEDASQDMKYGRGKVGMAFWVGNEYIDFYSCFGLPNIDTTIASTSFNSFYLMGELHFKLFLTDNTISFLTRPALYNELNKTVRSDNYDFDVSYRLLISSPDFPLGGGLLFNFKSAFTFGNNWVCAVAPYMSISMSGVLWNLYVNYDFASIYRQQYLDGLRILLSVSTKF